MKSCEYIIDQAKVLLIRLLLGDDAINSDDEIVGRVL